MSDIIGIHWTVTTHGTWLHGDPRGSWKNGRLIGPDPLLHEITEANMNSDAEKLSAEEVLTAGKAFGAVCHKGNHRVLAGTVRSTHAHLVFAPLKSPIETVIGWLKRQSSAAVFELRRNLGLPTPRHLWTNRRFVVFIDDWQYLLNTIDYVRRHNREVELPDDPYPWIEPLRGDEI